MNAPVILVALPVNGQDRILLDGLLAPLGAPVYLGDVPEEKRRETLAGAKAVISFHPEQEFGPYLDALGPGQLLQLSSAGLDVLPFDRLPKGLVVAGNAGVFGPTMAEHALGMLLCMARRIREEDALMRQGQFNQMRQNVLLAGKKAAVLGLGGAGGSIARLLDALGMEVWGINTDARPHPHARRTATLADLRAVVRDALAVFVTLPFTRHTRGLIDAQVLGWMRPDAIFINVARGEIVDEKALYEHLVANPGFRAGIESWWVEPFRHGRFAVNYPFLDLPNVLACPHNSFNVPEWRGLALGSAVANVKRYLDGKPLNGLMKPELHAL